MAKVAKHWISYGSNLRWKQTKKELITIKIGKKLSLMKLWWEEFEWDTVGDLYNNRVFFLFQEISEHFTMKEKVDFLEVSSRVVVSDP